MPALIPCELIARHVGELYKCSAKEGYIAIQTPFIFPDGDIIELYYKDTPSGGLLTDFGETLRWLNGQTPAPRRTKRHLQLIGDTCANHKVTFSDDQVSVRVPQPELMAESITRLIQAAIRITDISFTFRPRQFESFADEVAEFLLEKNVSSIRNHKIEGASGETWNVDFKTHVRRDALLFTLSTGNRANARRLTDHVVAAFRDLRNLQSDPNEPVHFISLVDDTSDAWQPEDFKRMEDVATVANWSRPDELLERLAA